MIENKQQTALEWYDNEIEKLFNQFTIDKINIYEFRTKRFKLLEQAKKMEKEQIEMYKQCLEEFVPIEKWDDATKFLSTYKSGLAKDLSNNETYGGNK
jgi:hypothetical protein